MNAVIAILLLIFILFFLTQDRPKIVSELDVKKETAKRLKRHGQINLVPGVYTTVLI